MVVVCCHLVRDVRGYGSTGGPSLTLGSGCGRSAAGCVGGVFEGSLRGAHPYPLFLLIDQLSA